MAELFSSFAQNFEDVILWRLLGDIRDGFYLDVGAAGPIDDSVSRGFYQQGWRGVHVEPNPDLAAMLRDDRPDEEVIEALIGAEDGPADFHIFAGTGLSTGVAEIADSHVADGREVTTLEVPTRSLRSVLADVGDREIHWMKIDVEGMEAQVLDSWGDSPIRPWVVVVESTAPQTTTEVHHLWEDQLLNRGYAFGYFDGLNRFYVHDDHAQLLELLGLGPNIFDRFTLTKKSAFVAVLLNEVAVAEASAVEAHQAAAEQNRTFVEVLDTAVGWTARIDALNAEVDQLKTDLRRLLDQHASLDQRRVALESELAGEREARHHADANAHALHAEASHLHAVVAARDHQIGEILSSTSWKVSGPVRALGALRHRGVEPEPVPAEPAAPPSPGPDRRPPVVEWALGVDDDTLASFNALLSGESSGSNDRG